MTSGNESKKFTDYKLQQAVREGDKQVFSEIYEQFFANLSDFAYIMVKDKQESIDIVQDVFLTIWKNRALWEPKGSTKSYLFKAVKNTALDYIKHQKVVRDWQKCNIETEKIKHKVEQPSFQMREADFSSSIDRAIEELPEQQKMVFLMSRKQGLTYSEIADILDISTKTVETHMGRALKKLRILLQEVYKDYFNQ